MPQTPPPDALGEEAASSSSAWTTHRPWAPESFCKLCRVACYLSLIDRRFIKPQLIYIFTPNFCSLVRSHQTRVVDESLSHMNRIRIYFNHWRDRKSAPEVDFERKREISQGWQSWDFLFRHWVLEIFKTKVSKFFQRKFFQNIFENFCILIFCLKSFQDTYFC